MEIREILVKVETQLVAIVEDEVLVAIALDGSDWRFFTIPLAERED